ncbi:MAG: hypothetical protein K9N46_01530 [Candidatus Marinimicrobia bacterium]|nr:hypothetical protein [Candidatus Neomarinimicrobiota bacterium]MCF7827842.1 hypothetical protein [Candidatus Neomarinimicrobiota bacterium]MCF7879403.1 hypothetical protein [Candidatus Neomarinimicrobiota bacterium]
MKNFPKFRDALYRLCTGGYSADDVQIVVGRLSRQARRFLFHREKKQYRFRGDWEDGSLEIDDLALDFIAPLFARDGEGVFIELARYFSQSWTLSDDEFLEEVYQLLNGVVQQQSVRLFRERDPFGRAFYRSLRYMLNKHSRWHRVSIEGKAAVAGKAGNPALIESDEISVVLKESIQGAPSLTEQMEAILHSVLDERGEAILIEEMLTHLRIFTESSLEYINADQGSEDPDPFLQTTIKNNIDYTVREVDQTVLSKYEERGKLSSEERLGFRKSLEKVLADFADGGGTLNYFEYLSDSLEPLDCPEVYKTRYRVQFEYVAKKAKDIFSAKIGNALSIHC